MALGLSHHGLERADLQFGGHQGLETPVVAEEIDGEIAAPDLEGIFRADEAEVPAQLQEEGSDLLQFAGIPLAAMAASSLSRALSRLCSPWAISFLIWAWAAPARARSMVSLVITRNR